MESHAARSPSFRTASDTREPAADAARGRSHFLPRRAPESSEHGDLADDQVDVADTATSVDNVQTPSTTTPDECHDLSERFCCSRFVAISHASSPTIQTRTVTAMYISSAILVITARRYYDRKATPRKLLRERKIFLPISAPPVLDDVDHESQFEVSHGKEKPLLRYLQDGLEIPYWKIMLDVFSAFRANKTRPGTDLVSLSLESLRFKARLIRHEVQRIVDESEDSETGMNGIMCGVDKRIEILCSLADYMLPEGRTLPLICSVMFGGEAMYPGQRDKLSRILPNATFRGCIYGSMDAGFIGESASDEDSRIYKVLTSTVLLEICADEEGREAVEANGVKGFLVASSYIRRLTPAIRYPVGDRGEWVDRDAGLFRVLGRGGIAVRLGPVSLDLADLRSIVLKAMSPISPSAVQAVVNRENGLDVLLCKIMARPGDEEDVAARIVIKLWEEQPMLKQHIDMGLIGSVIVKFVDMDDMKVNARTHKLLELVDNRHK